MQVDNVPQVSAFLHAINKLLCEVVTKLSVIAAASPAPVADDVRLQGTGFTWKPAIKVSIDVMMLLTPVTKH